MKGSNSHSLKVLKNTVLCRQGDLDNQLYLVVSGKLLIVARNRSMVTPIGELHQGDYFGEFSFFDNKTRSADVIAQEDTVLMKIPQSELKKQFPPWMIQIARSMIRKNRLYNDFIRNRGIKRKGAKTLNAFTIEEQRFYIDLLEE